MGARPSQSIKTPHRATQPHENMAVLIKSDQKVPETLQGFFNRAWHWAARPEFKHCVDSSDSCAYRNDEGTNACFIGACIPDKLYHSDMEKQTLSWVLNRIGVTLDLSDLQECHDKPSFSPGYGNSIKMLRDFAYEHGLKIPTNN